VLAQHQGMKIDTEKPLARWLGKYLFALAAMIPLFATANVCAQSTSQGSAAGGNSAAQIAPLKVVPAPRNDWWLGHFPAWLILTNRCFSQIAPTYEVLIEGTIAQMANDGTLNGETLEITPRELKDHGRSSFKLLSSNEITQKLSDFSHLGISVKADGFKAATYEVPNRSLVYAVDGAGSCVLDIRTLSASLSPLLSYGGMSNSYKTDEAKRDNNPIHPRRFAIKDSINIRVLDAQWKGKDYRATYVMRGGWGVDNERLSRLEVFQEQGRALVVLTPATDKDWKCLGMDSARDEFPRSESVHHEISIYLASFMHPSPDDGSATKLLKYQATTLTLKPTDWPFRYLTEDAKKQLPATVVTSHASTPGAMDTKMTIGYGAVPKDYFVPSDVKLLTESFYGGTTFWHNVNFRHTPSKTDKQLTLLPPKPGEGAAKGLSTYLFKGVTGGEKKTYELIIKTKGALPDDKLHTFAQIRQIPNAPDAVAASKTKSKK
jgi:hypothetical protein